MASYIPVRTTLRTSSYHCTRHYCSTCPWQSRLGCSHVCPYSVVETTLAMNQLSSTRRLPNLVNIHSKKGSLPMCRRIRWMRMRRLRCTVVPDGGDGWWLRHHLSGKSPNIFIFITGGRTMLIKPGLDWLDSDFITRNTIKEPLQLRSLITTRARRQQP